MEQNNKLETIFTEGSLTDQQNALETSLLRGGSASGAIECKTGTKCAIGSNPEGCEEGICCDGGKV